MELTTLGSLALWSDGALVLARRRKTLALLTYLAVKEGTPQSRDSLARLLWPDSELARARHSLRQALAELRQALPEAVQVTPSDITLLAGVVLLDVRAFEVARAEARWDDALSHWNGEFLAGADDLAAGAFAEWLAAERGRLRPLLASVVEADVGLALDSGDWARARSRADWWRTADPNADAARRLAERVERETGRLQGGSAPAFVGRDHELLQLAQAWREASAGNGRVVAVRGPAGVGTSRLVSEFVRHVERKRDVAFVRRVAAVSSPAAARRVVDELRPTPGRSMLVTFDDAEADDFALIRTVADAVPRHMLVIISGREDPLTGTLLGHPQRRDPRVLRLRLTGLDPEAARELITSRITLPLRDARQLAHRLHADTGGRPGAMLQLLGDLLDEGLIAEAEDGGLELARGMPRGPVPMALDRTERTQRRLARMTAEGRRVVEALAVLGGAQGLEDLSLVSRVKPAACREALREAIQRGLVHRHVPHGAYQLHGESLVEPIYELTPPDRRRSLHRLAARVVGRQARSDRRLRAVARTHRQLARPRWAVSWQSAARRLVRAGALILGNGEPSSAPTASGR
ncbi:MAG TPA: AAA family ATPase [Gemmatimonadales bacterium]|nr:AAA family ATPase [Gemmatimonadales bacterium]